MYGFDHINDATGFAMGDKFTDAADVRRYFTVASQQQIFPFEDIDSQEVLDEMAAEVIENHWHMIITRLAVHQRGRTPTGAARPLTERKDHHEDTDLQRLSPRTERPNG